MRYLALALMILAVPLHAQQAAPEELKKGVGFINTRVYTEEENQRVLELYRHLRVADVSDGMDRAGLPGIGLVDRAIHPDWMDREDFTHVFRGIALTVRYVPTQSIVRPGPGEDFSSWEGKTYNTETSETFVSIITKGNAIVIDDVEESDIGSIGSNNILNWYLHGAVGVITDAGARDTDEVAKEHVPLYLRHKGRGIRPGRNRLESVNRPVSIGGVLVCPGDVVVADGDGVVVVPRDVAEKVAAEAKKILENDKKGRKSLYEALGKPLDHTVQ